MEKKEDKTLEALAAMFERKIESMKLDWHKPWVTANEMPHNLNGREYSGVNQVLLLLITEMEGWELSVFMTFKAMQELNEDESKEKVMVNKGAKSTPVAYVSFTCIHKVTKEKISYNKYKQLRKEEQDNYIVHPARKTYCVFNASQTNIKEVRPELWEKWKSEAEAKVETKDFSIECVDKMLDSQTWICPINVRVMNQAYYEQESNSIHVPCKSQYEEAKAFYGTLFHEMAHSTGKQLGRKMSALHYGHEELVAEMTAAFVACHFGIGKDLQEESAAYLQAWLNNIKQTPDYLKNVIGEVKKAAEMIIDNVDKSAEADDNKEVA